MTNMEHDVTTILRLEHTAEVLSIWRNEHEEERTRG